MAVAPSLRASASHLSVRGPLAARGAWLIAACASLLLAVCTASAQTILEVRVGAAKDDAEQFADSTMYTGSSDLELVNDGSDQMVGMRWTGLGIPKGVTITAAWIQFSAKDAQSEATALTFRAQAADAALEFSSSLFNIGARPRGAASVNWSPPAWTAGQVGAGQRTPDLKALVQEVVNRPGWVSGNPLVIIVNGTGHRTAYAWNGDPLRAPLLHVEYSGGTPPPDQPPVANLSVTQLASPALTVSASAAGSTDTDATPIASYSFSFGDGTPAVVVTAPTQTATHTYASAGTYTVTLIATDTGGLTSSIKTASITVNPPAVDLPPVASLAVTQLASPALTVSASAAGSTDTDATPIASYSFNFGDGTPAVVVTAPAQTATHTYAAAGPYTVTLIATDTGALSSAPATASITVLAPPSGATTVEKRVAASADDAEQTLTGSMSLSSSDLEMILDSSDQVVGMRWTGLAIPRGAAIQTAWIQFSAKAAGSVTTSLTLRAQAADNALAFTSTASNLSSRPLTTASAAWAPVAWASGETGPKQRTPELRSLVQEVVSRASWASGNALAIVVTGTGKRTAYAWNGSSTLAPLLHVEYTTDGPPPEPPADQPPVAQLAVSQVPSPPLTVSASAAGSTDGDATPIKSYSFNFGDGTPVVVVNAPATTASHTYAAAGTYTVTLIATDTANLTSAPVTASITVNPSTGAQIAVYVGYYGTHHPGNPQPKPSPWMGSPGVTFVGTPDSPSGGWDTSAIRIDNLTGQNITGVVVTCDIGSKRFALWGTRTIPANGKLILAQTGFENFDGSDTNPAGCYGCDPKLCITQVMSTIPVVNITIGGVTTRWRDVTQVMNTRGADGAGCPYTGERNDESTQWTPVAQSSVALASDELNSEAGDPEPRELQLALSAPAPNPVRDLFFVRYTVPTTSYVFIGIYDVSGRVVKICLDRVMEAGEYRQGMPVSGIKPGVYYVELRTPQGRAHRSVVISR